MIDQLLSASIWPWMEAAVAFLSMLAGTPLVIRLAHRMDWLAYPKEDRWHAQPTALMGGLAIYAAATLGVVLVQPSSVPWAVWLGGTTMFATGLVDDLRDISPAAKLVAQIVATSFLLYAGYAFGPDWPFWLSVPFTFLWVVGITNAINLLDNMDGLAAGVACAVACILAIFSALIGSPEGLALSTAIAGAAGGFLVFNFKPARIFMGDCGSLFLGFSIAAVALIIQEQAATVGAWAAYLVPLAVLAVPIFDTTLVTLSRKLAGRPVSQGGRDHTSHRLVFLGLSERHAVLVLYGVSLLTGGLALVVLFFDVKLFYALTLLMGVAFAVLGIHLGRANVYQADKVGPRDAKPHVAERLLRVVHAFMGKSWKAVFGILADLGLVAAAFILAHYLRYEQQLPASHEALLEQVLPLVMVVKVTIFYLLGLYRGIWRHAGTPEIIHLVRTTALASLVAVGLLGVLYGFEAFSQSVFIIDWMIVTLAVGGMRFGFRGLRQYLASKRDSEQRALLYGAGDAGLLALREIRQNPDRGIAPVGFVDDDPLKQQQHVQGLEVLGTGQELDVLCKRYDVDIVLITAVRMTDARRMAIWSTCDELEVGCRIFNVRFDDMPHAVQREGEPSIEMVAGDGM